jgi:hypothetical protein
MEHITGASMLLLSLLTRQTHEISTAQETRKVQNCKLHADDAFLNGLSAKSPQTMLCQDNVAYSLFPIHPSAGSEKSVFETVSFTCPGFRPERRSISGPFES